MSMVPGDPDQEVDDDEPAPDSGDSGRQNTTGDQAPAQKPAEIAPKQQLPAWIARLLKKQRQEQ